MPRKARIVLPNCPHHVVQRGHNRQVVFVEDRDYQYYLDNLAEWKTELNKNRKRGQIYFWVEGERTMPRKARVVLPNCPHHVVQRGHNRQVVFVEGTREKGDRFIFGRRRANHAKEGAGCSAELSASCGATRA